MDLAICISAILSATNPTQGHLPASDGHVDGIGNGTTGNPSGAVGGGGGGAATFPSERLGGANRFATSVQISQDRFAPGVSVVYFANRANYADALAAGAASGGVGPVPLTQKDVVPAETLSELARLRPQRIVVLGGTSAISDSVLNAVRSLASASTTRVGGADRYATAAQVSASTFGSNVEVVYVATGTNFADALASGGAAQGRAPVLLVRPDSIPDATATELARLNPRRIVVLGGVAAVRASVQPHLVAYTSGSVSRVSGVDRYATSAELSRVTFAPGAEVVYVATGTNFADALSAAALGAPVLLARPNCIPASVLIELDRLAADKIIVLGGTSALSDDVRRLTAC